jgi:hypothetical protein
VRPQLSTLGIWASQSKFSDDLVDGLEDHDNGTIWIGSSAGGDLGIAAALLPTTRRRFAICAADIYSPAEDPRFIVAQRSATPATKYTSWLHINRAYPGRNCSRSQHDLERPSIPVSALRRCSGCPNEGNRALRMKTIESATATRLSANAVIRLVSIYLHHESLSEPAHLATHIALICARLDLFGGVPDGDACAGGR